jgi:predicted dinucleotide-binding enzyme
MRIGVLGSGQVGEVLANGFLKHGHDVVRGSRDAHKLASWQAGAGPRARAGTFAEAAAASELIVLAVKGSAAEDALRAAGLPNLTGKVVIDTTNPIAASPPDKGVIRFFTNLDESLMERLQRLAPEARLVKAFSCVGNALMIDPVLAGGPPTMFICGNDADAKQVVTRLLAEVGWEAGDFGGVEGARAIEPLCML